MGAKCKKFGTIVDDNYWGKLSVDGTGRIVLLRIRVYMRGDDVLAP